MTKPTRFVVVNGRELRNRRKAKAWTQADLAKAAGYTERTIRKAEKGGQVELVTVQDIAEALSIAVDLLTLDIAAIARKWVEAYESLEAQMLSEIEPYLAEEFEFVCPGDPTTAPFIGTWKGTAGFQKWLDLFFGFFQRQKNESVEYMVGKDTVVARWLESGIFQGVPCGPVRINMHFEFREGLIVRIEDDYDTHAGATSVTRAKEQLKNQDS